MANEETLEFQVGVPVRLYLPFAGEPNPPRMGSKGNYHWVLYLCKHAGLEGNANLKFFTDSKGSLHQQIQALPKNDRGGVECTITQLTVAQNGKRGTETWSVTLDDVATPVNHAAGSVSGTAPSAGTPAPSTNGSAHPTSRPSPYQISATYGFALREARKLWAEEEIDVTPTELHAVATTLFIQTCRMGAWERVVAEVIEGAPPEVDLAPQAIPQSNTSNPADPDDLPF